MPAKLLPSGPLQRRISAPVSKHPSSRVVWARAAASLPLCSKPLHPSSVPCFPLAAACRLRQRPPRRRTRPDLTATKPSVRLLTRLGQLLGDGPRPTVVMDAGLSTAKTIAWLRAQAYDWITVRRGGADPPAQDPELNGQEPSRQGQLGVVEQRAGGERGLMLAADALEELALA